MLDHATAPPKLTTRHRHRGASRTEAPNPGIPGGIFAAGLATGVLLTLAFDAIIPDQQAAMPSASVAAEAPPVRPTSEFQFYTLLNELEVAVPDSSAVAAEPMSPIWLQAGSFRSLEDADQLRASLILLNLEVKISQANLQGVLYHRVMVGPFQSRTNMAAARTVLQQNGIQPLPVMERPASR